jgi:hypothetical protein
VGESVSVVTGKTTDLSNKRANRFFMDEIQILRIESYPKTGYIKFLLKLISTTNGIPYRRITNVVPSIGNCLLNAFKGC